MAKYTVKIEITDRFSPDHVAGPYPVLETDNYVEAQCRMLEEETNKYIKSWIVNNEAGEDHGKA
jgi:hypothetical protein